MSWEEFSLERKCENLAREKTRIRNQATHSPDKTAEEALARGRQLSCALELPPSLRSNLFSTRNSDGALAT